MNLLVFRDVRRVVVVNHRDFKQDYQTMAATQTDRPLRVRTPLGDDKLLIVRFSGSEAISELFRYQLDLIAENSTKVEFDKIIGQKITVELDMPGGKKRYFHGLCSRLAEGRRDEVFTRYRMEVVPQFWLLTRRTQCRIFQQETIPDILKKVLEGFDVSFDLQGTYDPRDYCVQYRESDFAFASRLMEEEGIYYYFKHTASGHTLHIADTPQGHADVPEFTKAIYDDARGGNRPEMRITEWEKVQELRSGKVTLWDHCFELPGQNLETQKLVADSVTVGKVTHKLKVAGNDKLELYDYPGAYAQRYDGIDPGGGDRAGDLAKIFQDNERTAKIRMEQEAAAALELRGAGDCRQFTAGHKFTLENHHNADGAYVLLRVDHEASVSANYRSGEGELLDYRNTFTCLPASLPFRPPFLTPEPVIQGPQTATIVGPPGETIFCDKYGRVKVQFHWDRQGKKDASSSCWVRVSQNWGGAKWGGMFLPHVGQEVIVEFEEGDPDRPIITGRVYNAEAMPPLELPANKTQSIIRDHGANEIKMQGEEGKQSIRMYSPYGETVFKMGAYNDPDAEGFLLKTGKDLWAKVQGPVTYILGNNLTYDTSGDYNWSLKGSAREIFYGWKFEFVGGWKTDTVVGLVTEITLGGETRMILAGKKEYDPVADKKAEAEKQEIVGKFDEKIAQERSKIAVLYSDIGSLDQDISKLTQRIAAVNERIDKMYQNIIGTLSQEIGDLESTIKGETTIKSGGYMLKTSKGMIFNSGSGIFLEAKNRINMKFSALTMNGSTIDMKDGTLKIT